MSIKTIHDVTSYLENFYYTVDSVKVDGKFLGLDKHGNEYKECLVVADVGLFKNPEKTLSRMLVSRIKYEIESKKWSTVKHTQWTIEWRVRPEYDISLSDRRFAKVYARFSVYPKEKNDGS